MDDISGPEMARFVGDFLQNIKISEEDATRHHEDKPATQLRFIKDVQMLISTIEDMGSPFSDCSEHLVTLDSGQIMEPEICENLKRIRDLGQKQFEEFFHNRLMKRTEGLEVPLKKSKIRIFNEPTVKQRNGSKKKTRSGETRQKFVFKTLYRLPKT